MKKPSPLNIGWNPSLNAGVGKNKMPDGILLAEFESGRNRGSGALTHSANDLAIMNNKLTDQIAKWSKKGGYNMQVRINTAKKRIEANKSKMEKMRAERRVNYDKENDDFGVNPFAQKGGMPDYKDPSLALGGLAGQPLETVNRSSTSNRTDFHLNPEAYAATLQSPSALFDPATTDAAANMFFGNPDAAFGNEALSSSTNTLTWQQNYTPTTAPLTGETDWTNTLTS
jgi:hypothetical protein